MTGRQLLLSSVLRSLPIAVGGAAVAVGWRSRCRPWLPSARPPRGARPRRRRRPLGAGSGRRDHHRGRARAGGARGAVAPQVARRHPVPTDRDRRPARGHGRPADRGCGDGIRARSGRGTGAVPADPRSRAALMAVVGLVMSASRSPALTDSSTARTASASAGMSRSASSRFPDRRRKPTDTRARSRRRRVTRASGAIRARHRRP